MEEIHVKNAKQIASRLGLGDNAKILFMNRRGLKIHCSTEPIEELYIKIPYLCNYCMCIEGEIREFIDKVEENVKR